MPIDIFSALGAIVRAEAARTTPKPTTSHVDEAAAQKSDGPEAAAPAAESPTGVEEPSPSAGKRPLAKMLRKLAAIFG
ncbi:hypothetical protein ACFW1M_15430 [Streptomyces inhibens]|uniref:hypothetical protein n=1 Tax=Streptomyces inhibens TaxID=2293571 RepID=UPI0036C8781F